MAGVKDVTVAPVPIAWNPELTIFASEGFLQAVGDEYGWLGGFDSTGAQRCFLPYTIVRRAGVRMVRFRVQTVPCAPDFAIEEERCFLNAVVDHFRCAKADIIIPASTNTIFRTYPDAAIAAPYATHEVRLAAAEETLWSAVSASHRRHIRAAAKSGVQVRFDFGGLGEAHAIIRETFRRSSMSFMSLASLSRMVGGLGTHVRVFSAEAGGLVQSCAIIPFSRQAAYYVYGGSVSAAVPGSMHLLHWEAIRFFKQLGVERYDFCGARVAPTAGSKAAGLAAFKERFGAECRRGYMWKCVLRPVRAALYSFAVRRLRGGDIVDVERHKLPDDGSREVPREASTEQSART